MDLTLPSGTSAYLAAASSPTRGLVLVPDIMGLRPLFTEMADRLAAEHGWSTVCFELWPGQEDLPVEDWDPSEFLGEVLEQYYTIGNYIPLNIHVPVDWEDRGLLEDVLSERRGQRVRILDPQRGKKRELIDLVEKNATRSLR